MTLPNTVIENFITFPPTAVRKIIKENFLKCLLLDDVDDDDDDGDW